MRDIWGRLALYVYMPTDKYKCNCAEYLPMRGLRRVKVVLLDDLNARVEKAATGNMCNCMHISKHVLKH